MDGFLEILNNVLNCELFGISCRNYLLAFVAIFASLLVKRIIQGALKRYFTRIAEKTKTTLDELFLEALSKPLGLAVLLAGLIIALLILGLPPTVEKIVIDVGKVLFAAIGTWLLFRLIDVSGSLISSYAGKTDSRLDDQLVPLVRKTAKVFIAAVAFVLIVQNLGYSVSGLLAGLGLGGLALALAAKDTLSNLFGSATIFADQPFHIGDWIKTDTFEGVVEEVGFRSTKIRTFAKTLVTCPNNLLANTVIDNISSMPKRRIKMTVGVTYETSADQMEKAVEEIKKILREHDGIDQEFFLVSFTDFGPSSLDILVYCFTKTTVWEEYLKVKQEVNLAVMRKLEELGLSIAFPSQTVYMANATTN